MRFGRNGGKPIRSLKSRKELYKFRDTLELTDIGSVGPHFTYTNSRDYRDLSEARLDKCFVNRPWYNFFPSSILSSQPMIYSDHGLILSDTQPLEEKGKPSLKPNRFGFPSILVLKIIKNFWLHDEDTEHKKTLFCF